MSRTIFITGASSGIGAALATEFAKRGYAVAIAARRRDRLDGLADRLRGLGASRVLALELDVTDSQTIDAALGRTIDEFGRLDILIVNAGVGYSQAAGEGSFETLRRTIDTNLTGAIATIELALPRLRAQSGSSQIVAITSVAGSRGLPKFGVYSASKAGLHRYLQSLRAELRGESIVVTELAPGYIDTDMNRGARSRPFVIPLERGGAIMARMIERGVGHRYVPAWPWSLLAPLLKVLPAGWLAPRR